MIGWGQVACFTFELVPFGGLVGPELTFDFNRLAEVYQQADVDTGCGQVVHELHFVLFRQVLNGLDFDDDAVVYE